MARRSDGTLATPTTTGALPCALYSRVSTDDQVQAYGLTSQQHDLRALAERKGYTVVASYADEGVSGSLLDRPALRQLRDGVAAGRFKVVLIYAPDRLSRDHIHAAWLRKDSSRPAPAWNSSRRRRKTPPRVACC
jgi:predicted site-specific integrase-resolvase